MNTIAAVTWILLTVAHHDVSTEWKVGTYKTPQACNAAGQTVLKLSPQLDAFCVKQVSTIV